jgi:hypothetical protein
LENFSRKTLCILNKYYLILFLIIIYKKVSRAFGDIEAKLPELGGNPKVLISTPQIISFKLTEQSDFIVMGCKKKINTKSLL